MKDWYFSDSRERRTANTYLYDFPVYLDVSNRNNFTFYYVLQHNAGTNNVMRIAIQWDKYTTGIDRVNLNFNLYIHVSKSQIKISINPLFNESHLSLTNIPSNALEKKIWFWIWTQGTTFRLITSGSNVVTADLFSLGLRNDFRFDRLNVDDNPLLKIHGLITSNV